MYYIALRCLPLFNAHIRAYLHHSFRTARGRPAVARFTRLLRRELPYANVGR